MTTDFTGKTAIVTGGSQGIGRAIAKELGNRGASVVVNYRSSEEKAEEVVEDIQEKGSESVAVQADVSDFGAVDTMIDATVEEFGSLDIMINNAGMTILGPAEEIDIEDWRRVIDVNLNGVFIG